MKNPQHYVLVTLKYHVWALIFDHDPAQNLSSGFIAWSCAAVITTTPRRHIIGVLFSV